MQSKQADMEFKRQQAERRQQLTTLSTSVEEHQTYQASADMARAATAISQLNQVRFNLKRTKVLSPVSGRVTNLLIQEGDYATTGTRNLSALNTDGFWITGFFEETKLAGIAIGDPAVAVLMGYRDPVCGHVESIAQGINTPDTSPGTLGLASVDPTFTWVRLALGMAATVTVGKGAGPASPHGLLSRVFTQAAY